MSDDDRVLEFPNKAAFFEWLKKVHPEDFADMDEDDFEQWLEWGEEDGFILRAGWNS